MHRATSTVSTHGPSLTKSFLLAAHCYAQASGSTSIRSSPYERSGVCSSVPPSPACLCAKDSVWRLAVELVGDLLGRHYELIDILPHYFYFLTFHLLQWERCFYMLKFCIYPYSLYSKVIIKVCCFAIILTGSPSSIKHHHPVSVITEIHFPSQNVLVLTRISLASH